MIKICSSDEVDCKTKRYVSAIILNNWETQLTLTYNTIFLNVIYQHIFIHLFIVCNEQWTRRLHDDVQAFATKLMCNNMVMEMKSEEKDNFHQQRQLAWVFI